MENPGQPVVTAQGGKPTDRERILGAIAYIGPLFIVSYLMADNSKFTKFHANQGLVFFLVALVIRYVLGALMALLFVPAAISTTRAGYGGMMNWMYGGMGYGSFGAVGLVMMLVNLALLVLGIIAIIKAAQGEEWEMPVIGAWAKRLHI